MERFTFNLVSVPAEVSEFFRAELAAFVALQRRRRPWSWAHVERLQRSCLREAPASTDGRGLSVQVLADRETA